jgi:uncharacterized protein (UPF0264 family)
MTQLLVSVRDSAEARLALVGGADLIDIKEPRAGPLGAASNGQIKTVLAQFRGVRTVSAALGELIDYDRSQAKTLPAGLDFVKLGLARCAARRTWRRLWREAAGSLKPAGRLVAVVYADASAKAPAAEEIIAGAVELGCAAVLVDTFDKTSGDLLHHWSLERIGELVDQVRKLGLLSAVAGSLGRPAIERILPLAPDYIAVRGAACRGSRLGPLDAELIAGLANLVHATASTDRISIALKQETPTEK